MAKVCRFWAIFDSPLWDKNVAQISGADEHADVVAVVVVDRDAGDSYDDACEIRERM